MPSDNGKWMSENVFCHSKQCRAKLDRQTGFSLAEQCCSMFQSNYQRCDKLHQILQSTVSKFLLYAHVDKYEWRSKYILCNIFLKYNNIKK